MNKLRIDLIQNICLENTIVRLEIIFILYSITYSYIKKNTNNYKIIQMTYYFIKYKSDEY